VAVLASTSAPRNFPAGAVAISPLATWGHGCSLQVNIRPRRSVGDTCAATTTRLRIVYAPSHMKAHTTARHRRKLHRWDHDTCRLQFASRQAGKPLAEADAIIPDALLGRNYWAVEILGPRCCFLEAMDYGAVLTLDEQSEREKSTPELMKRLPQEKRVRCTALYFFFSFAWLISHD